MTSHPALARELLQRTAGAVASARPAERASMLAAIRGYLVDPCPSAFLATLRTVRGLRRDAALARIRSASDDHWFERGLASLRANGLAERDLETLVELPRDGQTGHRLAALGNLVGAYLELAARAQAATRSLRERLRETQAPSRRRWDREK